MPTSSHAEHYRTITAKIFFERFRPYTGHEHKIDIEHQTSYIKDLVVDPFSYLSVLISIVLALGMTRVLAGVGEMLQARSRRRVYWVHAIWIVNLFLYLVIAWWIFYRWRNQEPWTIYLFVFVLISPTILYLASLLLFPSESAFDEQYDINIKGAYFTIQKALPFLNDGASIILNTSVADATGTIGASAYSGTKAALRSLARTAAAELVGRGIRVNTVAPGPIVTPIFGRTGLPKEAIDEFAKDVVSRVPMKRFGQPEEVAAAVAFLASQDASYITGVEINVDGGYGQI